MALLAPAGQTIHSAVQERAEAAGRPGIARERVFFVNVITVTPGPLTPAIRPRMLWHSAGGLVTANERLAVLIDPDYMEVAFRISTTQSPGCWPRPAV